MRKTFRVVQTANRLVLVVLLLCSLTTMVRAQVDTLRKDTAPPQADTTTVSKENIQANLTKVDTTAPAVYKINPVSTILIGVAATGANMIAINNVLHNKPELSVAEIQAANRNILNGFDKWALNQDPTKRDHFYTLSDHGLTITLAASAATFLFNKKTKKDWLRLALMYYQTQFLTFAFYDFSFFGPLFQNRLRPIVYYDYFTIDQRKGGNQKNSFYSGHVANATAATFFAVKVYSDYHPEIGNKKYLLYGLASIPPLVTGWLRVKALAHFPSDVMAGFLIGGTFGILIPELHRIKSKNVQLNTFYNGQSGGLSLTYNLGGKKRTTKS
ncbi:MAG TPA: phosphatase PAP2 family protein [Flavisolibacter sp.]|nr:phosphatase PAP2 family protein [Flavisolibacter sp.]